MAPPVFSVVVPSYNRAAMLRSALSTVRAQSFSEWECLIVDDASRDETPAVLEEFKHDARIRALRNEKNLGMNGSRNRAIAGARGEFVTFLDSDDLWLPKRLAAFEARAKRSPEAGFIFSNAFVWRYGRLIGLLFDPARKIPEGVVPGHYAIGDAQLPYVTTNVAIRREHFQKLGAFKTEMRTLDTELFARFLAAGVPVASICEPLSVRRIHGEQLTDRYEENFREAMIALEASGASPEERAAKREAVVYEVAGYLWRNLEPARAREFLLKQLGEAAKTSSLFRKTFVPRSLLALGRETRKAFLLMRHHPAFASADEKAVYRFIEPLLARETSR